MKRPIQHVEQDISFKIFSEVIPSEWIIRDIIPDYGLDKSVEIVENGEVTGKIVFVQIKGTNRISISNGKISFPLAVDNLKDYMKRDNPVILAVVDLIDKKTYWLFLQQYVYDILEKKPDWEKQGTINILIPIENDISLTIVKLREIALAGSTYLISKKLDKTPIEHLEMWKDNSDAITKLLKVSDKLSQKQFLIKFDVSYRYQKENDYDKSIKVLLEIAEETKSKDPETYIKAILSIVYRLNPVSEYKEIFEQLDSIKELVEKSNTKGFKIMWKADYLETVFANLIYKYNSTRILHLVASQSHEFSMAPFLGVEITKLITGIYQVEKDFIESLTEAYQSKEFFVYLDLLRRLAKMQYLWCYNNSLKGDQSAINSQLKSIESTFLLAEKIAPMVSPDILFEVYLDLARLYYSLENIKLRDEYFKKAMDLAIKLDHKGFINAVTVVQETAQKSFTIPYLINIKDEQEKEHQITDEEEEKIVKELLEMSGIDINSNDEFAELARIGLRDRNPERILRYCENLHTEIVNYGPIWDMVALSSTGTKILFCEKKNISLFGMQLDELLGKIKTYCVNCPDLSPRDEHWKWSHKWHKERQQPEKMKESIKKFRDS
ncbi:MAG: DUF4365 domain-containing protein [Candidatus Bathyarchaeia archaeon]|jgi:hypothetical protein